MVSFLLIEEKPREKVPHQCAIITILLLKHYVISGKGNSIKVL